MFSGVSGDASITTSGESLVLLPEKAVFWPRTNTLLIADVHLGKDAAFQKAGIPVPNGPTEDTLVRLRAAVQRSGAHRLIILGDLWHAKVSRSDRVNAFFEATKSALAGVKIMLARGNHDRHVSDLGIEFVEPEYCESPFRFAHLPEVRENCYTLCGHIHPAVRLRGRGRQSALLPCFLFGERIGILPSFGSFTGMQVVEPSRADRAFVIAGSIVSEAAGTI